ncbi:MAG: flagellar basal body protein [Rhodobacteraceae bacterium]|nr:flagellar basal body protein [Paracoccaceae bacterium]
MGLESISFFKTASQRLQWLSARQKVISQNIANSDTPNFKAKDVSSFSKMLEGVQQTGLATTSAKHIGGGQNSGVRTETTKDVWGETIDGNTVVLEQQSILANEVGEDYQLAARLYRKGYELLTLAATGIR